ncbi:PREDICTED: cytosolic sulfotransferase 12-like [Camelina sativa]|uniref:Sulfotransferase n=1 Tax=Camelina sativa TaxID=90675 RepID=A0ABM0ZDA3_CAMSA|nr:PREDICTED: cytosolic sulfotransferase 12-like [Camelina sativa]
MSSSVHAFLGDKLLTQETRDLISSLPKEKGWLGSELYQFQGYWHTQALLQGLLTCQKRFEAKDSDIILITSPKSGTTWLKALVFSLVNRHKFPVPSSGNHPLLFTNPHLLLPFLEGVYYVSPEFDFTGSLFPRLMNTHISHRSLPESVKSSSCKIVYCCRNPKDMFVSFWHFGKTLTREETTDTEYPIEKAVEAFCNGKSMSGPFWDHILEYWYASRENPNKVFFVTYEELKKQPGLVIRRIAEFLGCGFTDEEKVQGKVEEIVNLCSFESLSNLEVNRQGKLPNGTESKAFFRKGEIGGWRGSLSESLAAQIDRTIEEKFHGSGLIFSS